MAEKQSGGGGKKGRKIGTHLGKCANYEHTGRREKNKHRREQRRQEHLAKAKERRERNHRGLTAREMARGQKLGNVVG